MLPKLCKSYYYICTDLDTNFREMSVIGVPIKVLHEAEGHIVTVETTTGEVR